MDNTTFNNNMINDEKKDNWFKRIGWLCLIWLLSVLSLAAVAFLFRLLMNWAGLTS